MWWKNVSIWWQRALFVTIVISRWEYKFLKCQFGVFTLLKNWKEESMCNVMNGVPDTDHTRVLNTTEYL